jgi:hypothetical protein
MNLTRVWELISGSPHQYHNAAMVSAATHSLSQRTEELVRAVKPYRDSEDPLIMFMTDVFNRREMRPGNDPTKLHT